MAEQMYRQGDVLLIKVDTVPQNAKPAKGGPVVLAYGELTGHAHEIKAKHAKLFERAGDRFLRLEKAAVLDHTQHGIVVKHPDHNPITLPSGVYRVVRQAEYSPEEIRNVAD